MFLFHKNTKISPNVTEKATDTFCKPLGLSKGAGCGWLVAANDGYLRMPSSFWAMIAR